MTKVINIVEVAEDSEYSKIEIVETKETISTMATTIADLKRGHAQLLAQIAVLQKDADSIVETIKLINAESDIEVTAIPAKFAEK